MTTFKDNLMPSFGGDYTQAFKKQSIQTIFAVLFNGCTGIMARNERGNIFRVGDFP